MQNIIMYKQGEPSWVRWIKKRIRNNLNFMAILEGPTGSGKSWSACSIAYEIDKQFKPKEQVCFSFSNVMKIINNFNNPQEELSKREYKVMVFDEVQVDLSNRAWQSKINKLFTYLTTTFRNQNIILLFTSPYSDFVDSATMKLVHSRFEIKGWNKKTKKTHIKPKILQYNSKLKKFYENSLYVIKDKQTIKMTDWLLNRPPEHIINEYEEMKNNFTNELNQRITKELEGMHKEPLQVVEEEIIPIPLSIKEKVIECLKKGMKKQKDMAKEIGCSPDSVSLWIKAIKNKQKSMKIEANRLYELKMEKPNLT